MPELPEVETLRLQIEPSLVKASLSHWKILNSSIFSSDFEKHLFHIRSVPIQHVGRKGKFLFIEWPSKAKLWIHLGMTGQLLWKTNTESWDKHCHVAFFVEQNKKWLVYRDIRKFGKVFWQLPDKSHPRVKHLGPDFFELTETTWVSLLKEHRGNIKNLLLNQKRVAGLGNIYASEGLFRAGIHPKKAAFRISSAKKKLLYASLYEILTQSIQMGGSSIDDYRQSDGSWGGFQNQHQVYGRQGKACAKCQTPIRKLIISTRSTFYCPHCQHA